MTIVEFEGSLRGFCRRRPFRVFVVEFNSGNHALIQHPEVVRREGNLFVLRQTDGGHVLFSASSVCRLLDLPQAPPAPTS